MSINSSQSEETRTNGIGESREDLYSRCRSHVLSRLREAAICPQPFYHTFIEDIFPEAFYGDFRDHMLSCKYSDTVEDRHQDIRLS